MVFTAETSSYACTQERTEGATLQNHLALGLHCKSLLHDTDMVQIWKPALAGRLCSLLVLDLWYMKEPTWLPKAITRFCEVATHP